MNLHTRYYFVVFRAFFSLLSVLTISFAVERGSAVAQTTTRNLSEQDKLSAEELKAFHEESIKKVDQLQSQLSRIASRIESAAAKAIYKKQTLRLFINEGVDVTIEVSSNNNAQVREYEVPIYLDRLSKLTQYAKVVMRTANTCRISNYYPAGTDENGNTIYEASATIYQEFLAYDESGKEVYRDVTTKTFQLRLQKVKTVLGGDERGERWLARIGDVKVAGTLP